MQREDIKNALFIDSAHIWHPYTQSREYERIDPLLITRAKGIKLYDAKGAFYYDTISSWWCNLLGHGINRINKAIQRQLSELEHTLFAGITHRPAIALTERLLKRLPKGLDTIFFSDNGSTAVEVALKISKQYWQLRGREKNRFVFLRYGYHGDTIGAMSVSGVSQFNSAFKDLFFKSYMIESPAIDMEKSLSQYKKLLKKHSNKICAIILEPLLQGAGGMNMYPTEFLDEVYKISRQYEIHIIVDEIATGFGRLGRWFAIEYSSLRPDFMCLSKSITNGTLPLAITATSKKIKRAFYGPYERTFFHGHTFTANPIACAAANETLMILEEKKIIENLDNKIKFLEKEVQRLKEYDFVENLRTKGLICAFEIDEKRVKKAKERFGFYVYLKGLEQNVLLRPLGNTFYLFLPIVISRREIKDIINHISDVLNQFIRR